MDLINVELGKTTLRAQLRNFRGLGEDFGSVEWPQVRKHEPWKRSPISTLDEWMQHAEKPRRLLRIIVSPKLISKCLPSKIEELLQVEKERERLTSLKEDLENDLKYSGWSCSYTSQVNFKLEQIKFIKQQIKFMKEQMYFDKSDRAVSDIVYAIFEKMIFEDNHNALNALEQFHSRYPRDLKITQLLEKIKRISGFLLGVVVLFIYQYLMGYVETGRWNTYSNGSWEFRATYVCIELRLGSYPFQKFRVTPRKYSGVTKRTYDTKNGVIYKYEPWVRFKKDKFYFEGQTTAEKAARIRDVAKFWLKIKGRNPYNFCEEDYNYLNSVQELHQQQSDDEIKRLVLEHAQPFLKEVQQSQEVPIVYQPPCVEPVRFASVADGEDNTIQGLSDYEDMIEGYLPHDTNEQIADLIEELQSVSPNPDIAGPTIEENIREHREALIPSAGPSLIQPKGTSEITLIAPCNGTGGVDLFTELKVFWKEKWVSAVVNFGPESYAHEGCSASMHKFVILRKSGDIQELSWSVEMEDKLAHFENHGWKIQL